MTHRLEHPRFLGCPFCSESAETTMRMFQEHKEATYLLEYKCRGRKEHKFFIEVEGENAGRTNDIGNQ